MLVSYKSTEDQLPTLISEYCGNICTFGGGDSCSNNKFNNKDCVNYYYNKSNLKEVLKNVYNESFKNNLCKQPSSNSEKNFDNTGGLNDSNQPSSYNLNSSWNYNRTNEIKQDDESLTPSQTNGNSGGYDSGGVSDLGSNIGGDDSGGVSDLRSNKINPFGIDTLDKAAYYNMYGGMGGVMY